MAYCAPNAGTFEPNYILRTEANDKGGMMGQILRNSWEQIKTTDYDSDAIKRMTTLIKNVAPMDWDEMFAYFDSQGWLPKGKKGISKIGGEEEGMAAAVAKTYLDNVGGGIRQLADNFLAKVNAGEDGTADGLLLAQQMQHASRLSGYILKWDQSYGRGVRLQGLRTMAPEIRRNIAQSGAVPEVADGMQSAFTKIAADLQSGENQALAVEELLKLAKRVQFTNTPLEAFRISGSVEIAADIWEEVWINGAMSSPTTAVASMLGAINSVIRPAAQLAAAVAYQSVSPVGAKEAQQAAVEAAAALSHLSQGFNDAVKIGWQAIKNERSIYAPLAGATEVNRAKAISGENFQSWMARKNMAGGDEYVGMIDYLGKAVRLPSALQIGIDEFAKHITIRGEVAARGVKRAADAGVDLTNKAAVQKWITEEYSKAFKLDAPNAADKYVVDLSYDYARQLRTEANRATFQEENGVANVISNVINKNAVTRVLLKPFIPFVRTPLNVLSQGVFESTGLTAMAKAAGIARDNPTMQMFRIMNDELMKDPGESFRVAGQIAFTGSLAALIYGGVMNGQITGGGPGRWGVQGGKASEQQKSWLKAMAADGRTPYSIQTPAGSVPFDRFPEPFAIVLRMVSDVAQYQGYMSQQEKDTSMFMIAGIAATGMYQASFLTGVDNFMEMWNDTEDGRNKSRAIQGWISVQTPFGGLLNFLDKTNDPYRKAYETATFEEMMAVHEGGWKLLMQRVVDRMPGMGQMPVMIDQVTGEPIPAYYGGGPEGLNPLQMAVPIAPRGVKSADRTWERIVAIRGSYREAKAPDGIKMTSTELQEMNKLMAREMIGGLTFSQWIDRFYNRPDVQRYIQNKNGTDPELTTKIESEFDKQKNRYRDAAFNRLAMSNGSLFQRGALLEQAKLKARNNDLSFSDELEAIDELYQRSRQLGVF